MSLLTRTVGWYLSVVEKRALKRVGEAPAGAVLKKEGHMAKFDIIAATGCPTGIAHTFMAKEALEKAAAERGLTIKVETHGQVGVENELTKSEIAGCQVAVVAAADKDVQADRFAGKPMVSVGVSKALSVEAAGELIDRALAAKGGTTRLPLPPMSRTRSRRRSPSVTSSTSTS